MGIIFWSALWVVLLCEWLTQKNEAKFKKNLVLGATLPQEAREDPEVQKILEKYRKSLNRVFLILGIFNAAGALIPDMAVSLICWSGVLILDLVLPMCVFARANGRLKALKRERGWQKKQTIRVDVSAMIDYPRPGIRGYLTAAALCAVPLVLQDGLRWAHIVSMGIVVLSYGFGAFCYRKKSETVDENRNLTRELSRLRYGAWNRIWAASAWAAVGISYSLWAMELSPVLGISLVILISLGFCGYGIFLEMKTRRLQEVLTAESGREWYADEDDFWIWGLFYYNPQDCHTMVNARTGAGSSFNLASVGGKIITGLVMAVLIGAMVLLISLGLTDRSEILLDIREDAVYCENGNTRYEVPFADMESVELLEELPEDLWRTNGLGGQHLMKGSFLGDGLPDLEIIADPTQPPYLLIRTEDRQYLFGARDPRRTEEIYRRIDRLK